MQEKNDTIDIEERNHVIDLDFPDFDMPEFDMSDFSLFDADDGIETRYQRPAIYQKVEQRNIKYDNAVKLARDLRMEPGGRFNAIISGAFIFGDFIEAYMTEHNIHTRKMTISTLSLSQENVDSLANLLTGGYVDNLNLIISHYFYANERRSLVPYIYQTLDIDDRFQLAVAGTHTKTVTFTSDGEKHIVMHGSANLRSSANIEQFTIEDNEELLLFYESFQEQILEKYSTIKKPIRVKPLWDLITTKRFK